MRTWRCELLCKNPDTKPTSVTVNIEDLKEHFCISKCKSVLLIKRSSILYGSVNVLCIFDIVDDYMIVHYSRNNPLHMSREIRDLLESYKPIIYVH